MRKRERGQLLPTPQTSTTSSNVSWGGEGEDDFFYSSEIDEIVIDNRPEKKLKQSKTKSSKFPMKRPRLLRTCMNNYDELKKKDGDDYDDRSIQEERKKSSWPFRPPHSGVDDLISLFYDGPVRLNYSLSEEFKRELLSFRRLLVRRYPYERALRGLKGVKREVLLEKSVWTMLLTMSTIYAGEDSRGDVQKRTEIAFAALTTLIRIYLVHRFRGGREQLLKLGVAAVVVQAKLLEEVDVDLRRLERHVDKVSVERYEKQITGLLKWKLLTPSPQVYLFKAMDVLSRCGSFLSNDFKLLVGKVLDHLIENLFLQKCFNSGFNDIVCVVLNVLELVLDDFFSTAVAAVNSAKLIDEIFSPYVEIKKFSDLLKSEVMAAIYRIMKKRP